jgi:hypothetical protein
MNSMCCIEERKRTVTAPEVFVIAGSLVYPAAGAIPVTTTAPVAVSMTTLPALPTVYVVVVSLIEVAWATAAETLSIRTGVAPAGRLVDTIAVVAGLEAPSTLLFTANAATPATMTPATESVVAIPVFMAQCSIRGFFPDE